MHRTEMDALVILVGLRDAEPEKQLLLASVTFRNQKGQCPKITFLDVFPAETKPCTPTIRRISPGEYQLEFEDPHILSITLSKAKGFSFVGGEKSSGPIVNGGVELLNLLQEFDTFWE